MRVARLHIERDRRARRRAVRGDRAVRRRHEQLRPLFADQVSAARVHRPAARARAGDRQQRRDQRPDHAFHGLDDELAGGDAVEIGEDRVGHLGDGGFARQRGARDRRFHRAKRARDGIVDGFGGARHRAADEIGQRLAGGGQRGAHIGAKIGRCAWVGHGLIRIVLHQVFEIAPGQRRSAYGFGGDERAPLRQRHSPKRLGRKRKRA